MKKRDSKTGRFVVNSPVVPCQVCGAIFRAKESLIQQGKQKFCSRLCYHSVDRRGYTRKPRTIKHCLVCDKKMSLSPSQVIRKYCSKKCTPSPAKGRKFSLEHRLKISKALTGANNYFYKDGRCTQEDYWVYMQRRSKLKRRNAEKFADGVFTRGEWLTLKERAGKRCVSCLRKEPEIKLTVDHIVPLARGGTNFIENIQPLCMGCNLRKGVSIIKYEIA